MNEDGQNDDKSLFIQYRAARSMTVPAALPVDPIILAAWVERRLDETQAAEVEVALAWQPVLLEAVLAASDSIQPETVSAELMVRLTGLVPASGTKLESGAASATILSYRPRPRPLNIANRSGTWLSWSAIAASLLLVSVTGLGVGLTAGQSFTDYSDSSRYSLSELLDSTSWMSDEVG